MPTDVCPETTLVVSCFVIVLVVTFATLDVHVPVPKLWTATPRSEHRRTTVPFWMWPLVGVALLVLTGCVSWAHLGAAIIGDDKIQPFAIILLFNAMAYLCLSMGATGALNFFSLKLLNHARGSGNRLFAIVFVLSAVITVASSNDIVILTLTPLVMDAAREANIPSRPFLMMQFFTSNVLSAVLIVGNPTNVIVGSAMQATFLSYFSAMALPSFACALACFGLTWLYYRTALQTDFRDVNKDAAAAVVDADGAWGQTGLLLATMVAFPAAGEVGVPVWIVATAGGVAALVMDLYRLPLFALDKPPLKLLEGESWAWLRRINERRADSVVNASQATSAPPHRNRQPHHDDGQVATLALRKRVPTVASIVWSLPLSLIPFVFGMFALVDALVNQGWVDRFAVFLAASMPASPIAAALLFVFLTVLVCNVVNNQPATILLTRVVTSPAFVKLGDTPATRAAVLGVVLGANLAANFTVVGALAGVMFIKLVRRKALVEALPPHQTLSALDFAKAGFAVSPVVCVVGALVVGGEVSFVSL